MKDARNRRHSRNTIGALQAKDGELQRTMVTAWTCLPFLLTMMSGVSADSWTCQQGDLTRHVLTFYPEAPARLPCQIFYSKPKENVLPRALWKATHDATFCERRAAEFADQLQSWGWRCSRDHTQQGQDRSIDHPLLLQPE